MPKLKPDTQRARRENILDAAEICFARSGFHASTIEQICKQAGISAGALYVYFKSKEELIAGIADRDRNTLADRLAEVAKAPDLIAALSALGEHYMVDEPVHKRKLCMEIACEATRNEAVGESYRMVDEFCRQSFTELFDRARAEGKINPDVEPAVLASIIGILGDGLSWSRVVDPNFDAEATIPVVMKIVTDLLKPVGAGSIQRPSDGQEAAE